MLLLVLSGSLPAQSSDCSESYITAMSATSVTEKYNLLKAWVASCSGKGIQYENFAYAYLCTLPVTTRTAQETVDFGEKALSIGGFDDPTQYTILVSVASAYIQMGKNLQKARDYAGQAISLAQANEKKGADGGDPARWKQMVGAGHYVQAQAFEKENNFSGAITAYINSYNILRNKQIVQALAKIGQSLYNAKKYGDAEKALKVASTALNDFGTIALYAKSLHRGGKKNEALTQYKKAYAKQKNGEIAYNIGLILAADVQANGGSVDETIKYLLEASFLSAANSEQAMNLAQSLYFSHKDKTYNDKVKLLGDKSKELDAMTKEYTDKYGEDEKEMTEEEAAEMDAMYKKIEDKQSEVDSLQAELDASLDKFKQLIEQTKQRLGIN